MNSIGHRTITREAIKALLPEERKWLGKEAAFLAEVYCEFPDENWPWFGKWGGEPGNPDEPYTHDIRREWNISYYCGLDPINPGRPMTPPGRKVLPPAGPLPSALPAFSGPETRYCPMGAYWAPKFYVPKIIEALEEGAFQDAIRFIGVISHHIEDRGAFCYWPDLHKISNLSNPEDMNLDGYQPKLLGGNTGELCAGVERRMREIVDFDMPRVTLIRKAYAEGDSAAVERIILEFWQEAGRAVADTIHSIASLVCSSHYVNYWGYWLEFPVAGNPSMLNLVENPSFEDDDGSGYPESWVIRRHRLDDKVAVAEWDWSRMHSVFSKAVRHGERSVKLMWTPSEGVEWIQRWPSAILNLHEGERYRCSCWVKTKSATGNSYMLAYLYDGLKPMGEIKGEAVRGDAEWRRIEFEFNVPPGVDRMRMACRSDGNSGAVWFDETEALRVEG